MPIKSLQNTYMYTHIYAHTHTQTHAEPITHAFTCLRNKLGPFRVVSQLAPAMCAGFIYMM